MLWLKEISLACLEGTMWICKLLEYLKIHDIHYKEQKYRKGLGIMVHKQLKEAVLEIYRIGDRIIRKFIEEKGY